MDEAPEFQDIAAWINTDPLTLEALEGDVVLLHFWAYTSADCRRTLPYAKKLWDTYSGDNFRLIGVHTPSFDFERETEQVRAAVDRLGIEYPVALDSKNTTWKVYGNRYWPRQTLIGPEGRIREEHIGDSGFTRIEERIRRLIRWSGGDLDAPIFEDDTLQQDNEQFISPTVHGGEKRGNELGNADFQVCSPYARISYRDEQPDQHELNRLYLNGEWIREAENACFTSGKEQDGYAATRFSGSTCTVVMASDDEQKIYVTLDGGPVSPENRGDALEEDDAGTFVNVYRPDMYELIDRTTVDIGHITITPENTGFRLYAFEFR